ncbi:MAG TPA: CHAT domain-containing protein [Longimicrobium sp.]|nr:CHAT domain-containing protein [Longimicrobium sp.]
MPNDSTASAAEALLAYRRGEIPRESPFRELSRTVAQALGSFDSVDPHTAADPRFLAVTLAAVATRDAELGEVIRKLAAEVERATDASGRGVSVHFRGDGNMVHVAGRDLHNYGTMPPATGQASTEPKEVPIDVLFAAAMPDDLAPLRVDQEARAIRETLERSPHRDRIRLHEIAAVRAHDLTAALLRLRPRIVHFSGHGSAETRELLILNEMDCSVPATAEGLRAIFSRLAGTVECVVMNACY